MFTSTFANCLQNDFMMWRELYARWCKRQLLLLLEGRQGKEERKGKKGGRTKTTQWEENTDHRKTSAGFFLKITR